MYLQNYVVLVALSIALLCHIQIAKAALTVVRDQGFTYFYEVIHTTSGPKDGPIASLVLAQYAASAYTEMVNMGTDVLPGAMTALWLPATQQIILASSAKGGPPAGFAYHPGNIPLALQTNLEYAAARGTRFSGWVTDEHNKGGACGEIVAMSIFFTMNPNTIRIPGRPYAKFVTVTQNGVATAPIMVTDACAGTPDGPGCRDFLLELGLSYCQTTEVPDPLRKRQGLFQDNALGRRKNGNEQPSIDLLNTVFECFKAGPLPSGAAIPTTLDPAIATSAALESATATVLPTLAPGDSDVPVDIASGTAVDDNGNVATTLVPVVSPSPNTPNPQIAPGSGKPGGNAPENSPQNPADGSGTNTNPQDPYANSGPGSVNPP